MVARTLSVVCGVLLFAACSHPTGPSHIGDPPPSASCAFAVAVSPANFPASGGSGTATVASSSTSGASCAWTATPGGGNWLSVSGATSGAASGSFNYAAAANTNQTPRSGTITLAWTGSTSGTTSAPITEEAAAPPAAVTASFTVKSNTGKADDNCEVTSGFKVRCTFDGTASTPAVQIASYSYVISETGEKLGTQATLKDPPLPGCNIFNGSSGGTIKATVVLTVQANAQTGTLPKKVTFIKNGVC
jgi:hypothetical protein